MAPSGRGVCAPAHRGQTRPLSWATTSFYWRWSNLLQKCLPTKFRWKYVHLDHRNQLKRRGHQQSRPLQKILEFTAKSPVQVWGVLVIQGELRSKNGIKQNVLRISCSSCNCKYSYRLKKLSCIIIQINMDHSGSVFMRGSFGSFPSMISMNEMS